MDVERMAGARTDNGMREFTYYFRALVGSLGEAHGWFAVLARRDPGGVRAYLDGTELPPWDVVLAVLHDVAAQRSTSVSPAENARARRMHRAAADELDAAPDAEQELRVRLDAMRRQWHWAQAREHDAAQALRQSSAGQADLAETDRLANDYAWARDDRERAVVRCQELQARLDAVVEGRTVAGEDWFRPSRSPVPGPRGTGDAYPGEEGAFAGAWDESRDIPHDPPSPGERSAAPAPVPDDPAPDSSAAPAKPRDKRAAKRRGGARYGGARFAGAPDEPAPEPAPVPVPDVGAAAPAAPPAGGALRGARFAGAVDTDLSAARGRRAVAQRAAAEEQARRARLAAEARALIARYDELRATGATGEAYVLMSDAASGPAERTAHVAGALEAAGRHADVATLLWEAAAQPPERLAATAAALDRAGRPADGRTVLHQAAARPASEVAGIAAALCAQECRPLAVTLLAALVGARTVEEAAGIVYERHDLAGPLLEAADTVSADRRRDLAAVLRRAGLPHAPQ